MSKTVKGNFNKKVLSVLIERARGDRSVRRFAQDSGVSYLQLRKLLLCQQENPPGDKLLTKLAKNSANDIELEDYFFAAGKLDESESRDTLSAKEKYFLSRYRELSSKQQRTAEDFIEFLSGYKRGQ